MTNNIMIEQSPIEHVVMRRIYRARVLRAFLSNTALAAVAAVAALWGIGREVWVARVFQNAPTDFISLPRFYISAFLHTSFIVEALSLIALAALIVLARETARFISSTLSRLTYALH